MKKWLCLLALFLCISTLAEENTHITVMNGNFANEQGVYDETAKRILQAFRPKIATLQQFHPDKPVNEYIHDAFGKNYDYYQTGEHEQAEAGNSAIIFSQDFQLLQKGQWNNPVTDSQPFTFVRLDVPGDNPHLMVVSVHFSQDKQHRQQQARSLVKSLLQFYQVSKAWNIPDYLLVGGTLPVTRRQEKSLEILTGGSKGMLTDWPIPTTPDGDRSTNITDKQTHNYLLVNRQLKKYQSPVKVGKKQKFPHGLIFDSRSWKNLSKLEPVQEKDSASNGKKYLPVLKAFLLPTKQKEATVYTWDQESVLEDLTQEQSTPNQEARKPQTEEPAIYLKAQIRIIAALVNPPGEDFGREFVTILNASEEDLDLTSYYLASSEGGEYKIPELVIPARSFEHVRLPGFHLELPNHGGTIELYDPEHNLIHAVKYSQAEAAPSGTVVSFGGF